MKALVVHAHSEANSFVSAMRDAVVARLQDSGAEVLQSDLYKMGFNPVLSPRDFGSRKDPDHLTYALEQRHGYETKTLSADILAEIEKVLAADLVVFTFPIFWFSVPAILKGWIDRVLISGPFYGGLRIYGNGGLKGKKALAVFSLGGREYMFGPKAIHGDLETGMLRHFLQGVLGYVGFDVVEPFVGYHTPYITQDERTAILGDLSSYVGTIDRQPLMPMPDLARYDQFFKPLDD
jgi:NAD(P)H dehydrogenase (quinone)